MSKFWRWQFGILLGLFASLLVACTPSEKYPETYGIYYWTDGRWNPLSDSSGTVDLDLQPEVRFLIHQKSVELYMRSFELAKKVYVRNIVQRNPGEPPRETKPYKKWDKQKSYFVMKGQFGPVKGQPEMVVWTPVAPLAPGIYEPIVGSKEMAVFSVNRKTVLGDLEDSEHCFDLIKTNWGGLSMGQPDEYKPCAGDPSEELLKAVEMMYRGDPDLARIKKLLARGGNPTTKSRDGTQTAFGIAVYSGRKDIVEAFLEGGANVNSISNGGLGIPASFSAFQPEVMATLISRGLNVKAKANDGMTALHVFAGNPKMVTMLLDAGAEVSAMNKYGHTPLARALDQQKIMQSNISSGIDKSQLLVDRLREVGESIEILRMRGGKT